MLMSSSFVHRFDARYMNPSQSVQISPVTSERLDPKSRHKSSNIFQPHRDPDHARGDPLRGQLRLVLPAMARRGGMAESVVCTSPRLGANGIDASPRMNVSARSRVPRSIVTIAPKPPLSSRARERELRVRLEARIVCPLDLRVPLEPARQLECGARRPVRSAG